MSWLEEEGIRWLLGRLSIPSEKDQLQTGNASWGDQVVVGMMDPE